MYVKSMHAVVLRARILARNPENHAGTGPFVLRGHIPARSREIAASAPPPPFAHAPAVWAAACRRGRVRPRPPLPDAACARAPGARAWFLSPGAAGERPGKKFSKTGSSVVCVGPSRADAQLAHKKQGRRRRTAPEGAVSTSGKVGFRLLQQPTRKALTHEQDTTLRTRSGAHGDRIGAHRRRQDRRWREAVEEAGASLPGLRQAVRMLRLAARAEAVAGAGRREVHVLPGIQRA